MNTDYDNEIFDWSNTEWKSKQKMKIIVHGFEDYEITKKEFLEMYNSPSALIGAEQVCRISIGNVTKTAKEWVNQSNIDKFLE